ncbi:hypothetical protein [Rhizobium sp. NFR03]|uniref:hypothetical protein n=1 Tax=Rhizobium sp. NFR03 TaxID=1566263 RepID=UPI00147A26C6|nr:hypothetical protein [Rhizobium sp. NFR03]
MMERISPGSATRIALVAAGLLLVGWAGMLGWWAHGPDMVLALAAGSLSLCF